MGTGISGHEYSFRTTISMGNGEIHVTRTLDTLDGVDMQAQQIANEKLCKQLGHTWRDGMCRSPYAPSDAPYDHPYRKCTRCGKYEGMKWA
jgi:hypothetical protein